MTNTFTKIEGQSCFQRYATPGERKVARKLVRELLDRGYTVSVQDGEEWTVNRSTKLQPVLDALCSTGEDLIRARATDGKVIATFTLIWGNDESGEELIADYSANPIADAVYNQATA